jgi:hypothetical protein
MTDAADAERSPFEDATVVEYLQWGALAVFVVLAAVSLFKFYASATAAIATWVAPAYEPAFQAAFNLGVLLVSAAGASVLARRLGE